MNLSSINNIYFLAFKGTEADSITGFNVQKDLKIYEITCLPQKKVLIGRAPGSPKYIDNRYEFDINTLRRDIEFLEIEGVDTVIDLRHRKYESLDAKIAEKEECLNKGIQYVSIELDSAIPPTEEQLDDFFKAINSSQKDKKVYIHCHAGKDRTGIMASCYLAKYQGMGIEEAFRTVFDNRSVKRLYFMSSNENCHYLPQFYGILEKLRQQYFAARH